MTARRLGKACSKSSVLFLCDMQEKFRKTIQYYPQILNVAGRMLQASRALDIPVVVTEQYPQGKPFRINVVSGLETFFFLKIASHRCDRKLKVRRIRLILHCNLSFTPCVHVQSFFTLVSHI
jgi:hypothetical protein